TNVPYEAELRNLFDLSDLQTTLRSIRNAENLRKKFDAESDVEGLRRLRELAISVKRSPMKKYIETGEAIQWITLWLQSPELFENWIKLRTSSGDFKERFGQLEV
ncbi:MAG TPA: hypothetical protein VJL58_09520, partial [Pyrinomonadaceae bacterium]|nr:hypothetical protein [Pyrinomonadaceae bacterium]